jgi:cytoskeletal protein CcmA (bactofilin family)
VSENDNPRGGPLPGIPEPGGRATQHLDEMACLLYIERQLDRVRAQEVSAHTQECNECRTLLRAMERESRLLTRAMLEEDEALPARLAQFQERARRSMQWIWGVLFGLAATGVYALYTGYIEPWEQQLAQAGFGSTSLLNLLIFQGAFWKGWQSVITLLEVVAMLTLGGFGLAFFRKRLRRGSAAMALVLTGFCGVVGALMMPPAASAQDVRRGDTTEVRSGETIKGDIFIFSHHTRIDGTVDGDVYLFTQDANVGGHVKGDVIAFAQSLRVTGEVDGNVRAFTNNLTVTGNVTRNVLAFQEILNLDPSGKVGGSMTAFAQSFNLDGQVGRNLLFFAQHGTISGTVEGNVDARGEGLRINGSAKVGGPIHFEGENAPDVSSDAKLASPVDFHKMVHKPKYEEGGYYVWQVIWIAAFVLFGLVLFQVMPGFSKEAVDSAEHYGASFGLGVLVFFGVPIASLIACATVVGLFVGISTFFLWYATLYYAQIVVGALVGQWLLGRTRETWPLIGRMVVGVVIVRLCTTVPHIGGWVKFGVMLWGTGAISLALYRRFQPAISAGMPGAPIVPTPLPSNTTIGGALPA